MNLKNFLYAWTPFERGWFLFSTLACIATSILMRDTPLSFVAALTGIWYTLIAGKGFRLCYPIGIANCICYTWMAVEWRLFGDAMLYGLYYLPMMFAGYFAWKKKLAADSTIIKTRLTNIQRIYLGAACLLGIALYAGLLYLIGGRTPGLDSATNVLSAAAMILTVKRCIEQWILWFLVNIISILMWTLVYVNSGEASSIIIMYVVFLASGIIFYFKWKSQMQDKQTWLFTTHHSLFLGERTRRKKKNGAPITAETTPTGMLPGERYDISSAKIKKSGVKGDRPPRGANGDRPQLSIGAS